MTRVRWMATALAAIALWGCDKPQEAAREVPVVAVAPGVAVAASAAAVQAPAGQAWELVSSKDGMTDELTISAELLGGDTRDRTVLSVRCTGSVLEVLATFNAYLGTDSRPVKYRVDQHPPQDETWSVSEKGISVFALEEGHFARQLMGAKKLLIEATDFSGVALRTAYEWAPGGNQIAQVLTACKRPLQGLETTVPGLRKTLAVQLERWGPRNIQIYKRALAGMGGFAGEPDGQMTPEFALAIQAYLDSYSARCKAGKVRGRNCEIVKALARVHILDRELQASSVIYEQAPKSLQKEVANLRLYE